MQILDGGLTSLSAFYLIFNLVLCVQGVPKMNCLGSNWMKVIGLSTFYSKMKILHFCILNFCFHWTSTKLWIFKKVSAFCCHTMYILSWLMVKLLCGSDCCYHWCRSYLSPVKADTRWVLHTVFCMCFLLITLLLLSGMYFHGAAVQLAVQRSVLAIIDMMSVHQSLGTSITCWHCFKKTQATITKSLLIIIYLIYNT